MVENLACEHLRYWTDLNVHYTEHGGVCILESCEMTMEIKSFVQFYEMFTIEMSIERGFILCNSEMAVVFILVYLLMLSMCCRTQVVMYQS